MLTYFVLLIKRALSEGLERQRVGGQNANAFREISSLLSFIDVDLGEEESVNLFLGPNEGDNEICEIVRLYRWDGVLLEAECFSFFVMQKQSEIRMLSLWGLSVCLVTPEKTKRSKICVWESFLTFPFEPLNRRTR